MDSNLLDFECVEMYIGIPILAIMRIRK